MKDRLPKSRATITVRKKVESRVSRVHGIAKREQHVRIHIIVDGGDVIGPSQVLGVLRILYQCFGIFRFAYRYCSDVALFSQKVDTLMTNLLYRTKLIHKWVRHPRPKQDLETQTTCGPQTWLRGLQAQ